MRYLLVLLGLTCLTLGCPQGSTGSSSGEILVVNDSGWPCRLKMAVAGVENTVDIAAGESTALALGDCPADLTLINQIFDPDGAAVETSFAEWSNRTLTSDDNYFCGDRIVIQIGDATTTVYTEATQ